MLRRSPVGIDHHHHRRAVTLPKNSSTSLSLLLDQEGGDRHRAVRVRNAEVPSVRHLIGTDHKTVHGTDRGTVRATDREDLPLHQPRLLTLPLSDLQGYVDPVSLLQMHIIMIGLHVRRKFFV